MRATAEQRIRWRPRQWLVGGCLIGLSLFVTRNTWLEVLQLAEKDEETQYVLLAPAVAAWLVWVRRARLSYCRPGGQWVGLLIMLGGWALWSLGYRRSIPTALYLGPPLLAAGALVSVTGRDLLVKFFPAFAALLFMVPLTPTRRHIIAAPLEQLAAAWTQWACELLGMSVRRYGNLLSVNGAEVEVAEACNGMRLVVAFGLVAYAMSFGRPLRWYARLLILLAVPMVAIGCNVLRLIPTVWVYSRGDGSSAQRFHDIAGWVTLALAWVMLLALLAALRWAMVPIRWFQLASA
jgi:exosortase